MKRGPMKRAHSVIAVAVLSTLAGTAFWLAAQSADARPIPALLPPGALIYLEAKDFGGLLAQWNKSSQKRRWLASANYRAMSMSRLVTRLAEAQNEYAEVAGIPVAMNLTEQIAGARSGFAFYNLSKLSFVYLTQMPQSRLESSSLWRSRTRYQTRDVAGIPFYVKTSGAGRTIAFTAYNGWFVVSTSEDRMAATLLLLSGAKAASLSTEGWFVGAEKQARQQGDLRLVYNLHELLATPQFRTYWIQRNETELKPYGAGISDLFEDANGFEERRAMLRNVADANPSSESSLSEAMSYAPADASLYRAWNRPASAQVREVLNQVAFAERPSSQAFNAPAPEVTPEAGALGNESDLEVRIDERPFERPASQSNLPLADALDSMQPLAMLHVQNTVIVRDRVFVMPNDAMVVVCRKPDQLLLDQALAKTSGMQAGALDPLRASINGQAVILARMDLTRSVSPPVIPPDVVYAAIYNHHLEWPRYKKLFQVIDTHAASPEMQESKNVPPFFSGNLRSLGDALSDLRSASIMTSDTGDGVRDTVRYEMAKP